MTTKKQVRKAVYNAVREIGPRNILKAMQLNDDPKRRGEIRLLFGKKASRTSQIKSMLFCTRTELTDEATEAVNKVLAEDGERLNGNIETLSDLGYRKPVILTLVSRK